MLLRKKVCQNPKFHETKWEKLNSLKLREGTNNKNRKTYAVSQAYLIKTCIYIGYHGNMLIIIS